MECFIVEEGTERKAELEDLLPLISDWAIQNIFRDAHKSIDLGYALAHLPDEIKNMVYRNLLSRIRGGIEKDVKDVESTYTKEYGYIKDSRAKLISLIGEYRNGCIWNETPERFVWKEIKPKEKIWTKEPPVPIEELIKKIEEACNSGSLYFSTYYAITKDNLQNAFAAFQDRKNELRKILKLTIDVRILSAAAPLFEAGKIDELEITGKFDGTWPSFLEERLNLSSIKLSVWEGLNEFPLWIRNAVSLRRLYISTSDLTYIPDWIGDMQSLTELTIYNNNENFKMLPDNIGNLKALTKLNIHSMAMEKLPDGIGNLFSLKELILEICKNLTSLPDGIGNLKVLTKLTIDSTAIEKLPDGIGNLFFLNELILGGNKNLTSLPDSIGNLKNLIKFKLSFSPVITLPDWIENLQNLTELSLYRTKIEKLPECIGNLEKLSELTLTDNENLKYLPDSIGRLKNLIALNISDSPIEKLPDTIANCSSLECVDIRDTNVNSFPDFLYSIKKLIQSIELIPKKRNISYRSFCNYYYTLVETILRFHNKARREGLLALDDELEILSNGFFKEGLRLVLDGTDARFIQEFLTLKIEREHNYYIKKLKEIAMEGILYIQSGHSIPKACVRLASMADIKNNPLDAAYAKYLAGDSDAFDNIDFKSALQPEEEREEIRFIKRALRISEISRRDGWLEVEKYLDNDGITARDVFEYGLPMVVDGWDYEDIEKNLTMLVANETDPVRKNIALAKKNAVKMIYEGYNSRLLLYILTAYFDDEIEKECLSEFLKD